MNTKAYIEREKFRCVLEMSFDPVVGYERKIATLLASGLTRDTAEIVAGMKPTTLLDSEKIERSLAYTFDVARKGAYVEGRFNTSTIAALYTGSDPDCAMAERRHHWSISQDPALVVFTVKFTGDARDIRAEIVDGTLPFPEDHKVCQTYAADAVASGLAGIAAPSKRHTGSSCCAIFDILSVRVGSVVLTSNFA